jgi:hypothetical protein
MEKSFFNIFIMPKKVAKIKKIKKLKVVKKGGDRSKLLDFKLYGGPEPVPERAKMPVRTPITLSDFYHFPHTENDIYSLQERAFTPTLINRPLKHISRLPISTPPGSLLKRPPMH